MQTSKTTHLASSFVAPTHNFHFLILCRHIVSSSSSSFFPKIQLFGLLDSETLNPTEDDDSELAKMGTLGKAIYTVGFWIRETGQAIDRLGCRLQGNYYFQEQRTHSLSLSLSLWISLQ